MDEITCPVASAAIEHGSHPALIKADRIVSCAEYDQLVTRAAVSLESAGLSSGDCVGILSDNSINYAAALMACFRTGIIASPLSTRLPAAGLASQIERIRADALLCSERQKHLAGVSMVKTIPLTDLFNENTSEKDLPASINLDQPATVIFTSGSTGAPKGVLHPYSNHYYSALGSGENIPFLAGDRWLLSLPLYHVGGLAILFRAMLGSGAVVIDEPDQNMKDTIITQKITHLSLVHTQLQRLLANRERPGKVEGQLKAVLLGGSGIPEALLEEARTLGWPVYTSFGMTEMASQITTTNLDGKNGESFSSGKPLKFRQVRISDEGEIHVRGETLFRGYVDGPKVARPFNPDGWFATGDMGHLTTDGNLIVTGRKDNMFISGGENIHPEEIESALCSMESITAALVVPLHHEEFGFRPAAFIKTAPGHEFDTNMFARRLGETLPRFKIPEHFYSWPADDSPLSSKPDRQGFQALADMLTRRK